MQIVFRDRIVAEANRIVVFKPLANLGFKPSRTLAEHT